MDMLKAKVAERKHDWDVKRAQSEADRRERDASFAVDYAVAEIEQAKLAVLDAIISRVEAERAKST